MIGRHVALPVVLGVLGAGVYSAAASAHAFLIRSRPEAGARLAAAPGAMALRFSEPFVSGSERVEIRRADGHALELARARGAGTGIDQPLPANLRGVFIVSWRVVSNDGHVSAGRFAFGVGTIGVLPKVTSGSQGTSWPEVAPSWLMFVGLALALGGLLSELFVWAPGGAARIGAAPAGLGVILASAAGLLELVLLAGNDRGGGFASGLNGGAIANALGTRPGGLTLATLIVLVIAGILTRVRSLRAIAILPLLVAVVLNAARGHSGTSGTGWAVIAGSLHLAAVGAWVGALAHLVLIAARSEARSSAFLDGVRRYSRFALPTVLLILATGLLTAIPEFRSVDDVVTTGYGRILLIKAGLVALALLFASASRLRGLESSGRPRFALLRRLTLAEATTLLAVLAAVAVLANTAPPRAPAQAEAPASLLGPAPVAGPTVQLADLAGQLVVSLTAGPRELQLIVFAPGYQAPGAIGLTGAARRPDGSSLELHPRACGTGCFSVPFMFRRGVTDVTAHASSSNWRGGKVGFAIRWPPGPEQPAVIRRIAATVRAMRSVTFSEQVTLPYGTAQPPRAQSLSGRQFLQVGPLGVGGTDVRSLGTRNGLTEFAFVDQLAGSNIWYRIWVDRSSRLRRELIVGEQGRIYRTFP